VDQRLAPVVADDVGADDEIADVPRHAVRKGLTPVDREGQNVRNLVHSEVLALELARLLREHEDETDLTLVDPLRGQHLAHELDRRLFVDGGPAAVRHLDLDHPG